LKDVSGDDDCPSDEELITKAINHGIIELEKALRNEASEHTSDNESILQDRKDSSSTESMEDDSFKDSQ
jgi:hypothetical protein